MVSGLPDPHWKHPNTENKHQKYTRDLNLFRDIFPAARCELLICFLSTPNTPQLAAGIFYFRIAAWDDDFLASLITA